MELGHHLLADWGQVLQEILWNMEEVWDESRRVRQYQRHVLIRALQPWTHKVMPEELMLTMVWWITRDFRSRKCILENSQTHRHFKARKSINIKTPVCAKSALPHITMHWIREVDISESMNDLVTSRSITGRQDFTDYDMLDAMIASVLKELLTHVHFRKRVSVKEQRAQKDERVLRGRQFAYMIFEHFQTTGACEAVQGLSDLFNIRLHTEWWRSGFRYKMGPSSISSKWNTYVNGPGGFIRQKLHDSVQLQKVLALYEQENIRNNEQPSYSRLKTSVRRHIDQTSRTRNKIVARGAVNKSRKGRKVSSMRKVLECYQWKAIGQC